mmetsp:Transcript_12180/g.17315  ORF Transcript_12180/g.17315 Transcript_12180/m.17315 type:complete len:305 (-) Transcript_12180:40-954(-)
MAEEATINPDGSQTFADSGSDDYGDSGSGDASGDGTFGDFDNKTDGVPLPSKEGIDPAVYLVIVFICIAGMWFYLYMKNKRTTEMRESFFAELDGDKFNIKLPDAVDEYYQVREKCEDAGWVPGKPPANAQEAARGPARVLAQALMKRCIADIPIVTHIQKESAGMNKLYSQSMCSIKQWKSYQAAEALVSSEVDEVRAEADEIEPGWSEVIWRQAMQYHNMLKNKQEMEAKQLAAKAEKARQEEEEKKKPKLTPEQLQKAKEEAAEKAAQELLKMEEREKEGKKAFTNSSGMKKGFLDKKAKK